MTHIEKLKKVFITVIGVPEDADFAVLAYGETPGWDSVAHMALISEIESSFDVMLETEEVIGMSSFPIARNILSQHGIELD